MPILTQTMLKQLFNCQTGVLIWKIAKQKIKIGDVAGCLNADGYRVTSINNARYYNHRLIWLWHYGYLPENYIDHINQNKSDNRIENLREASQQCNSRNCGNPINNTSGVKGVVFEKRTNKWVAQIMVDRKLCTGGHYKDFDNAACARLALEQCFNWSNCDSSSPAFQYVQEILRSAK